MRSKTTLVGLIFIAGFGLAAWVINRSLTGIFAQFNVSNQQLLGANFTLSTLIAVVVAGGLLGYAYTNKKSKAFVTQVIDEISKVAWPEWSETRVNTVVVIVFSFIAAGILGVFDTTFNWLTNLSWLTGAPMS